MKRYLRLYGYFVRFSVSRALEFRFDFFFRVFMDLAYYTMLLIFFKVIFRNTNLLGGWTEPQVMVFMAGWFVVDALQMTVISNNLHMLPSLVNRGDLDYYLVRPVSTLFFVSVRDFAVNSLLNLAAAVAILGWALQRYPEPLGWGRLALFCGLLLNGVLLFYLIRLILLLPVFWTHSVQGLQAVFYSMIQLGERPDGIYHGWVRRVLLSVLPFALIISYPARLLFEPFDYWKLIHLALVTAGMFATVLLVWRYALRAYSSASS